MVDTSALVGRRSQTADTRTASKLEKSNSNGIMPAVSTDCDQEQLRVQLGGKTLRNEELIRQNFAMKDFINSLTETIGMHQYTDKESPASKLAKKTQQSFFMKEQALVSPDSYQYYVDNATNIEVAQRVAGFMNTYKTQPRYNEDNQRLEHQLRDNLTASVRLPKKC